MEGSAVKDSGLLLPRAGEDPVIDAVPVVDAVVGALALEVCVGAVPEAEVAEPLDSVAA